MIYPNFQSRGFSRRSIVALGLVTLLFSFLPRTLAQTGTPLRLSSDSLPKPGVPRGRIMERSWNDSKIFPGTTRSWWIYVPAQYQRDKPACVMVFQDGYAFVGRDEGSFRTPVVFDNLIAEGAMPVTIGIFVNPGNRPPSPAEKARLEAEGKPIPRPNRSVEYDTVSDRYARFLLEEIIPAVASEYNLSNNPDDRAICGNSSGGICAFSVAWSRPEAFRKVVIHIGSFTNIRGGQVYPQLVRQAERKPLRVFLQDGANDLRNEFGCWPAANLAMASALAEKGYDYRFVWGDGAHETTPGGSIFPTTLRWLWRDQTGMKRSSP